MSNRAIKLVDFYSLEENDNFLLFRSLKEKCYHLFKIFEDNNIPYYDEIIGIQNVIENNLQTRKVEYNIFKKLVEADETGIFLSKINVIFQNEEQSQKIYNELLNDFNKCKNRFEQFENIVSFYETFFKKSKAREIEIIKKTLIEYQNKNISEIINVDNFFENVNDAKLVQLIKALSPIEVMLLPITTFFNLVHPMKALSLIRVMG